MITDEMLLPFVPFLCGLALIAFLAWVIWAVLSVREKYQNSQLEEARQAAQRVWEDAHPSWVDRKREYLRKSSVPVEYIDDPRVVIIDGRTLDEWPTSGGVIQSAWEAQDQDPRWREPAHG